MINITDVVAVSLSITEAQSTITPLIFFIVGIVAYSVFIFKFYRFLARKDIFNLELQKYSKTFFGFVKKLFSLGTI